MIGGSIEPSGWHPLRFAFQPVDFCKELAVGALLVAIDNDHIKIMAVNLLHFTSLFDNLFQFIILLQNKTKIRYRAERKGDKNI